MIPNQPTTLGRYEIKKLLGRGAMGRVYLAEDPMIGREVAVKAVRIHAGLEGPERDEIQGRFQQEVRAAGTLSHPNIVPVFDVGQDGEDSFIAMEYVQGESLEKVLESDERKLSFGEIADIAYQLASALDYAHKRGIVHRDVKPANVLVNWDGQAKITDFGIVKMTSSTMTRTGTIIGTPAYMSPEQVVGREITGASDQFSLAVILYQMLTGERPFGAENPTSILYKIVHQNPLPPQEVNRELPPPINGVILKALAKEPAERYPDCKSMAAAIREALGAAVPDGDMTLGPTDLGFGAEEPKRGGGWLPAALVALLLVGGGAWFVITQLIGNGEPAVVTDPSPPPPPEVAPPPPEETPPPPETPVVMPETVQVTSNPPGARVLLDGQAAGTTPAEIQVMPGQSYNLRVELAGYKAQGMPLAWEDLSADQRENRQLSFKLESEIPPGFVTVSAPYPVSATVGGKRHGPDAQLRIPLRPGTYEVSLAAPEVFLQMSRQVQVSSDGEIPITVPPLVQVSVTARPGNCNISIDGRPVDVTPIFDLPVTAGRHELLFEWPAEGTSKTLVEVVSPSNRSFSARSPGGTEGGRP